MGVLVRAFSAQIFCLVLPPVFFAGNYVLFSRIARNRIQIFARYTGLLMLSFFQI